MLYGHGAGFNAKDDFYKEPIASTRAVLYDEGFQGRGMNMYEFRQGIEASAIKHPQMIYFHNCLMGNLESLTTLRYLTDYFVGWRALGTSSSILSRDCCRLRTLSLPRSRCSEIWMIGKAIIKTKSKKIMQMVTCSS